MSEVSVITQQLDTGQNFVSKSSFLLLFEKTNEAPEKK